MLQCFENIESAVSKATVYNLYKRFQDSPEDSEDNEIPCWLQLSKTGNNVAKMTKVIMDNPELLQRVMTGDDTFNNGYFVEKNAQSSIRGYPESQIPKKLDKLGRMWWLCSLYFATS